MPSQSNELLALRAQTAQAAYATILSDSTLAVDLARPGRDGGADFTPTQAAAFAERYQFVAQEPNDSAGFSWTLLRDKQQAANVYRAWRRMTTPKGQAFKGTPPASMRLAGQKCARRLVNAGPCGSNLDLTQEQRR